MAFSGPPGPGDYDALGFVTIGLEFGMEMLEFDSGDFLNNFLTVLKFKRFQAKFEPDQDETRSIVIARASRT